MQHGAHRINSCAVTGGLIRSRCFLPPVLQAVPTARVSQGAAHFRVPLQAKHFPLEWSSSRFAWFAVHPVAVSRAELCGVRRTHSKPGPGQHGYDAPP